MPQASHRKGHHLIGDKPIDIQQLFDQLWGFHDPVESESRFRQALGPLRHTSHRLEVLTQIARAQGLQRRFDDAHATLDEVERDLVQHQSDPSFDAARLRCLLERGRVFNSAGEPDKAVPPFERAWALARQIGDDHLAVDAAHMIAIAHGSQKRANDAMEWNQRALHLAESSTRDRARQWRGSLHNNIGWTLHDHGQFVEALGHFEKALACRIEQNQPSDIHIARWCIGRCLRSLGRLDEALAMQSSLHNQGDQAGGQEDGYVFEELGECLLALNRPGQARSYFADAHRLLSADPWLAHSQPRRLRRLAELAGIGAVEGPFAG